MSKPRYLRVLTAGWEFQVRQHVWYPHHLHPRLSLSVRPTYDIESLKSLQSPRATIAPHGLIGQSWDGDQIAISGRTDDYYSVPAGHTFTTSAQAEGAIEGSYRDYQMSSPFATAFRYSRFDAKVPTYLLACLLTYLLAYLLACLLACLLTCFLRRQGADASAQRVHSQGRKVQTRGWLTQCPALLCIQCTMHSLICALCGVQVQACAASWWLREGLVRPSQPGKKESTPTPYRPSQPGDERGPLPRTTLAPYSHPPHSTHHTAPSALTLSHPSPFTPTLSIPEAQPGSPDLNPN